MSSSSSSHQGGTLSEMAPRGTTIPNDAGKQNTIPSGPRPEQRSENRLFDNQGLGQPSSAFAADNDATMPRGPRDPGMSGEVVTGTSNTLPAEGESKGNQIGTDRPGVRGDTRNLKHGKVKGSELDE
ncbi:hypothetical protein BDV32DRAFT_145242 [Aspergillus pseudonomiae]|uniref:Uncharacterized protein n=1 Tax=Aspergillus pseudonomiae TaxID=1506151 RepID=A0A5N7DII2_9EURO|nr:uncharacterized protein BDV37DRAFT_281307 [Aspergillus pseudonomiae]KAB8264557.1 hypothetical protein BDV32DRAFT_145242 [Aspergillus pseudonomiae]KAE8406065.1 hypothetical protein BDV37DRAFT_281307 [Aspergillus pseudonomiae]